MKPLKFQQVQDAINAITTDWSIRGPFHEDDGKYYALLHGEWVGDGYLNKRLALDAIYAALREGPAMTDITELAQSMSIERIKQIALGGQPTIGEKERLAITALYFHKELQICTKAFQTAGLNQLAAEEALEAKDADAEWMRKRITGLGKELEVSEERRVKWFQMAQELGEKLDAADQRNAEMVEALEKAQRANNSAPAILRQLAEEKQKRGEVAAATAFNYAASALQKELSK